jgi:AcrR family transcriptional regulator
VGVTVDTASMTTSQRERRDRVIDAAMQLAAEGGYDAVQMRDVATKADVALGTVYRYFGSKDHLLAASLASWVELLYIRFSEHPSSKATAGERVLDVLNRALRALGSAPVLGAALFASIASPDPQVVACQQQVISLLDAIVLRAIGDDPPSNVGDRARMIGHVWYSALAGWVAGWSSLERVASELAIAVGLLLP